MLMIKSGYVKTMAGSDIENGCVIIDDAGKIAEVGTNLQVPEGAVIIDAEGKLVTPGCVEAHCHVGLHNEAMQWEGRDYNERVDPVTPHLRAIDSINPLDEGLALALEGGVTTACTGPGSANVVGGTFAAIKLSGKRVDKMIVKAPLAMKCAFGENPKRCYGVEAKKNPVTRMGIAALLRELLFKTKRYMEDKQACKNPAFDMKLESMTPVIEKKIPLQYLPLCAGLAVKSGLDYEEAWRAITINPAVHTGIGDRVGSLEVGKDGDVVIWSADPLTSIHGSAYMTILDGKVVYRAESDE